MDQKDKRFYYNKGTKREAWTNASDTFSRRYIWRARHGEMTGQLRSDFTILLADKNGKLTKKPERFSYPIHYWNDLIEDMADPGSYIWRK